jgi:hypothetical protein
MKIHIKEVALDEMLQIYQPAVENSKVSKKRFEKLKKKNVL